MSEPKSPTDPQSPIERRNRMRDAIDQWFEGATTGLELITYLAHHANEQELTEKPYRKPVISMEIDGATPEQARIFAERLAAQIQVMIAVGAFTPHKDDMKDVNVSAISVSTRVD